MLGLTDINTTNLPVQILPNGAKEVSTGSTHSLILMLDGTLLGSGVNSDGQLGLGDLNGRTTFTKIATGVMRLADVMNNEHIVPSANNMEMLWVDPGTFTMGSPVTEVGRQNIETEHNVTLTRGFFLGKYEVTQAEYQAVMTGNTSGLSATPSQYNGNPDRPVEKVSWNDVQIFLDRLNSQESNNTAAGWKYALPTEAEWEYACRANTTTAYFWGNSISASNGNYGHNIGQTQNIGQYTANSWGFYDMHGNIWEWVADWYQSNAPSGNPVIDPIGPNLGSNKILRGGAWDAYNQSNLRSARRSNLAPTFRSHALGFRLALRQVSLPPTDLNTTAPLTIAENQPIGSIVGDFNATDPDSNATLTYHLVSGVGDDNNSLFTMESNGSLKTATTFDYESNASSYSIRVQAKDEYNATSEQTFTVSIINILEDTDNDGFSDTLEKVHLPTLILT